jgi:hypothetical protein
LIPLIQLGLLLPQLRPSASGHWWLTPLETKLVTVASSREVDRSVVVADYDQSALVTVVNPVIYGEFAIRRPGDELVVDDVNHRPHSK